MTIVSTGPQFSPFGSETERFCGGKLMGTCQAAIAIYLDIVNLFLFLLQLFGERRR